MIVDAPYIDLAQVLLYVFWLFFAGLVIYLLKENKREGYPLVTDRLNDRVKVQGWPAMPGPKTFKMRDSSQVTVPNDQRDMRPLAAQQASRAFGSPYEPTGNPMTDGVGPAAYAERANVPDTTYAGLPKIVPLRVAVDFHVDGRDPDPRGLPVVGADGSVGGTVVDAWVDRSESLIRYLEVDVGNGARRLLPMNFSRVERRAVRVQAILGGQFKAVPQLANAEQVTLLEEDKICAYYGGGTLYATPQRQEPML